MDSPEIAATSETQGGSASRFVTISRIPIAVSLLLAGLKWYGVAGVGSLAWEWAFAPWWIALCLVAFVNHRAYFGRTRLTDLARIAAILALTLTALRLLGFSGWVGIGWWALTSPFWMLATICWFHSFSARYADREMVPAGRFYAALIAVAALKWYGVGFFAAWSWLWMGAACAVCLSVLCVYNVVRLGGGRYLPPAYIILLFTVPLAAREAWRSTEFNLNWALVLLPAISYGCFCRLFVIGRIRELRQLMSRRNEYISGRLASGAVPRPVPLERQLTAMPLPGSDARFRLYSALALVLVAAPLHAATGVIVGWLLFRFAGWVFTFHPLAGAAVFYFLGKLSMYSVYFLGTILVAAVARRCNCAHRPTLWLIALVSAASALVGFGWSFVDFFGSVSILDDRPLAMLGFVSVIFFFLFSVQAGVFGLMKVFTPVEWEPLPDARTTGGKLA